MFCQRYLQAGAIHGPPDRSARRSRRARHAIEHAVDRSSRVGGGLGRPARPVPTLRQRERVAGAVFGAPDGRARRSRRARHAVELAALALQRGWGWTRLTNANRSQRCANSNCLPALLLNHPTAVHAVADVHDTPSSTLLVAPSGFGVGSADQRDPSQRCANSNCSPALLLDHPTAVHAVADVHDTPSSSLLVAPGLGVGRADQREPSQRSANVKPWPVLLSNHPTAVHAVADVHDTLSSPLMVAPAGLVVGWAYRRDPSQLSANVTCRPALPTDHPTVVHAVADVHDTPPSTLVIAPAGLGVGRADQPEAAGGENAPANTATATPATVHGPHAGPRGLRPPTACLERPCLPSPPQPVACAWRIPSLNCSPAVLPWQLARRPRVEDCTNPATACRRLRHDVQPPYQPFASRPPGIGAAPS